MVLKRTTKEELQSIHEELELLRSEVRGLLLEVKVLIENIQREQTTSHQPSLFDMEIR